MRIGLQGLLIVTLAMTLFLSGCQTPAQGPFCGDNVCEPGERNTCSVDCGSPAQPPGQSAGQQAQTEVHGTGRPPAQNAGGQVAPLGITGGSPDNPVTPSKTFALPDWEGAYSLFDFSGDFTDSKGKLAAVPSGNPNINTNPTTGAGIVEFAQKAGNDYLTIQAPETEKDSAYTVILLLSPETTGNQNIFSKTDSTQSPPPAPGSLGALSHQLRINNGVFEHYTYDGAGKTVTGSTKVEAGKWYFVAIIAKGNGEMKLYVDGAEEGTVQNTGTLWQGGNKFELAAPSAYGMAGFKGQVDTLAIYREELTAENISDVYYKGMVQPIIDATLNDWPVCGDDVCQAGEDSTCSADCTAPESGDPAQTPTAGGGTAPADSAGFSEPKYYTSAITEALPTPERPESNQEFYINVKVECTGNDCKGRKAIVTDTSFANKSEYGLLPSPVPKAKTSAQVEFSSGTATVKLGPYKNGGPSVLCGSVTVEQENGESYSIPIEVGVKATKEYCDRYPDNCDNYAAKLEGTCFQDYFPEREIALEYTYNDLKYDIMGELGAGQKNALAWASTQEQTETAAFFKGENIPKEVQSIEGQLDSLLRQLGQEHEYKERAIAEWMNKERPKYIMELELDDYQKKLLGKWKNLIIKDGKLVLDPVNISGKAVKLKEEVTSVEDNIRRLTHSADNPGKAETLKILADKLDRRRVYLAFLEQAQSSPKYAAYQNAANQHVRTVLAYNTTIERKVAQIKALTLKATPKYTSWGKRLLGNKFVKWGLKVTGLSLLFATSTAKSVAAEVKKGSFKGAADKALEDFCLSYAIGKGIVLSAKDIDQFMKTSMPARGLRNEVITDLESSYGKTFYTDAHGRKHYYDGEKPGVMADVKTQEKILALAQAIVLWKEQQGK